MAYLIRESNQNDNNIIHNFNKELESHGFNFSLPVPISENLNTNSFIHVIDSQLQHQYAFPVYHKETFEVKVKDYNAHTLTVRRKSLRPELQAKIEPSAIAKEIGDQTDIFSSLQISGVQFFRWNLKKWERFCFEHAKKRLEHGENPCWLRRIN